MYRNSLTKLIWFVVVFVNFAASRIEKEYEYDLITKSKKIIESLEDCEVMMRDPNKVYPIEISTRDNLPITDEKDVKCGVTTMAKILTTFKYNLDNAPADQVINITIKAIKKATSFADLRMIVENEMIGITSSDWLVLISNTTHSDHPLENVLKKYMDYSIALIRLRLFDLRDNSIKNDCLKSVTTSISTNDSSTVPLTESTINISNYNSNDHINFDLLRLKEKINGFDLETWLDEAFKDTDINDLTTFKYIFDIKKTNIYTRQANSSGKSFLHLAVEHSRLPLVRYLIEEKNMDVNVVDDKKRAPIHFAASSDLDTVIYLASKGANVNLRDSQGFVPAHYAIIARKLPILRHLIEVLNVDPKTEIVHGYQLVHFACNYGCDHCVEYLVTKLGIDVNTRSERLFTPLMEAAKHKNIKLVRWLVKHPGVDLFARDFENKTALQSAEDTQDNDEVIQVLGDSFNQVNNTLESTSTTATNYTITTTTTIASIAQPLVSTTTEYLPETDLNEYSLHIYAARNSLGNVKKLIEFKKFDPNHRDQLMRSPAAYAAMNNSLNALRYLLEEQRVNRHAKDKDGNGLVHLSAINNAVATLRYLIKNQSLDSDGFNAYGQTPLFLAASKNALNSVRILVEDGNVDLNYKVWNGSNTLTPLTIAVANNHIELAKYLLKKGAIPSLPIEETTENAQLVAFLKIEILKQEEKIIGFESLNWLKQALELNELIRFKYIFEIKRINPFQKFNLGKNSLHFSVEFNRLPMVKYCIETLKLDPNIGDHELRTAAHYAASRNLEILIYLVSKGADVSKRDSQDFAPVHYAIIENKLPILRHLIEFMRVNPNTSILHGYKLIHFACNFDCDNCVEYLVTMQGVDVNSRSDFYFTPLHVAAKHKNAKLVRWLIKYPGIDLFARDLGNKSALQLAKEVPGNDEVIQILSDKVNQAMNKLELTSTPSTISIIFTTSNTTITTTSKPSISRSSNENFNVSLEKPDEMTVKIFTKALKTGDLDLFKSIFEKNQTSVYSKFENSKNFLHYSADYDLIEFVKWLIEEKRVDVNVRDSSGKTAVHYACRRSLPMVKLLVENGANINLRDSMTRLPIHIAASDGTIDIVRWFVEEAHQDPQSTDIDGLNAIDYAFNSKQYSIVNYLMELNSSSVE